MEAPLAQRTTRIKLPHVAVALAILAAAAALFFFNPANGGFYPRCLLKATTGLDCPGCGGLRAMHQLLHGNVATAFDHNPLLLILLPIGAMIFATMIALKGRPAISTKKVTIPLLWVLLVVAIAYTILRNLPHPALAWMAS